MKLIHCGDIHLDSKMKTSLSRELAKERRSEILLTFSKMVEFAASNDVKVILIAGDLFDTDMVTKNTKNVVRKAILDNPQIDFLYLKGNHDKENFLGDFETLPENLKLFGEKWCSYDYGDLSITGVELSPINRNGIYGTLKLERDRLNIVVLHGQDSPYAGKDDAETIPMTELRNKNIDYLALGHIHKYKTETLDSRGTYCYCGCLEGRGFDECGPKGFVLLDTEKGSIEHLFMPFARRTFSEIQVDISGAGTTVQVADAMNQELANLPRDGFVKIVLVGRVDLDAERNLGYLKKKYDDLYYSVRISDQTKLTINAESLKYDVSLKGEFIRYVISQNFPEDKEKGVIEAGLKALAGEELEL